MPSPATSFAAPSSTEIPTPTLMASPTTHCAPGTEPVGIVTGFVYDQTFARTGKPTQASIYVEFVSLDPMVPYRAGTFTQDGMYVFNSVPARRKIAASARFDCAHIVRRVLDTGIFRYSPGPCEDFPGHEQLNFGGPATPADPDAPAFAITLPADANGNMPTAVPASASASPQWPSPCPDGSADPTSTGTP